ncbi:hypothetical protein F2P56_027468 [Juglans regia]|uniref:RING-type E3 ubiquitin transferase n=2 Tax=Juglans regia TaxID=51240 RepID=A0A2I4G9C4_JUGRE|nr:E3 ubiquitin-protein ligase RHF1A-like isoform X1 [Juglans regia]KAF5452473.1 hypothetical protein F2P56_027468 [Juglans regia]
MANVTPYSSSSSSSSSENPAVSAASSSSGVPEDVFEDACSICLEPFTTADPSTITSCKHEYHLHCILEWSQRSKECPICCQLLVLRDSASQELLAAVGIDRHSRSRNSYSAAPTSLHSFCKDFDVGHDIPNSDVSDFDERIMQHLTAATSRAQYVCRRERQRYTGNGPSQVLAFTSPTNMSRQPYAGSPEDCPNLSYRSTGGRSASLDIPSADNFEPPASVDVNLVSSTPLNRDIPFNPSILYCQPPSDSPRRPSASEMLSFPETLKSKLSAASSRYKESISKSTRGFKEKLLAHNDSVKELGKEVQRELNAGIVGLARMIERLDLNSKQSGSSVPVFSCTGGTSNLSFKGKGVEGNVDARSLDKISGKIACDLSPNATFNSGAIHGQSGNPHPQSGY